MAQPYEKRVLRVLEYMFDNPAGDLSLDRLAEVAAMSRFHWHRVFHAMTGETCAEAVRRLRLHRAACWLVQTSWPLSEIAAKAGYGSVQSFARAFRASHGLTPGQFRDQGAFTRALLTTRKGETTMYPVEIATLPERRLLALPHQGPYMEIGGAFERLSAMLNIRNRWPDVRGMAGVYYDDPSATPAQDLCSHAGVFVAPEAAGEDGLEEVNIAGGRFAVLHFKGSYAGLQAAYEYLYGTWLPASGQEPRDAPCVEVYLNAPADTAPEELLTDVCLPLA